MRVEKTKQVNNTNQNQGHIDLQKVNSATPVQLSHSETKYEPVQYHSASSKAVPQITLQRITDSQIEQLSKKQQFLFENDINEKLQGIVHSSRIDHNSQRKGLFQNQSHNQQKFQHQFSAQMAHESNLVSSQQLPQPRHANHQIMHSHHQSLSETRSLKSFRSLHDQRLQRQLNRRNDKSNQGSNSGYGGGGGNGNNGNGGGSQQRQLSNVREMFNSKEEIKLFESKFKGSLEKLDEFEKEWEDFKVSHTSVNNGDNSTTNYNQSQSASKALNDKEFTLRIDKMSKLNQSFDAGISIFSANSNPNVEQPNTTKNLLYNSQQSVDNNSRTRSRERKTPINNYQTQILSIRDTSRDRDRDRRPKPINADFRNQLDQINESPRESILQSPTSNYHNDKVKQNLSSQGLNVSQKLSKSQRQQQQMQDSNYSNNLLNKQQQNKECKTLKIDLNEDKASIEARNLIRKAALRQQQQYQDESNNNSINSNSNSNNFDLKNNNNNNNTNSIKSTLSSNQVQQAKKMVQKQASQAINNESNLKNNLLLSNQNKLSQRDAPVTQSQSAQQIQKKDDLVERVIESIKVLNKKEEEIKQHQQQIQSKSNQHQVSINPKNKNHNQYDINQFQQQQSLLQQLQPRKRTNTLTTGERPNIFGSSNLVQNQGSNIAFTKNNNLLSQQHQLQQQQQQQQQSQTKENSQPMSQQIAQLKRQVQQQQQQKQQPQTSSNSSSNLNGFIGNSFIKTAQEKEISSSSKQQSIQQDKPQQDQQQQQKDFLNTSLTINNNNDTNQSSFQSKFQLKSSSNLSHSGQSQSSQEQITQKPQTSLISKGTVVSQSTKDKVEQLRKAFASNKDSAFIITNQQHQINLQQQSRSTKNLMSQSQNSNNFSSQVQNVVEKHHNFKNSNNNNHSSQTIANNIKANMMVKSEKTTKRADISLVNENAPSIQSNAVNLSLNLSNQGGIGGGSGSNSSLNVTASTPSKQTIANIKKQNQITPSSKLNIATSPTHQQSISNNTSLINMGSFSHSIQAKRNSQQLQNQQQNSTPVVSGSGLQTTTAAKTSTIKTKNSRRQPTQTQTLILSQIDQANSQNQSIINNSGLNAQIKIEKQKSSNKKDNNGNDSVVVEVNTDVERVDGQKLVQQQLQKKKHTMLDEYFHASPHDLKNPKSQRSSANNSKQISLSRLKNKIDVQIELEQDILESEREFLEQRQNKLNFQPIQEPSINWNPSPERQQMPEKKFFQLKGQQQQQQQPQKLNNQNQGFVKVENRVFNNIQQQPQKDYSQENDQQQEQEEEIENENRIEQRLNHLLEQTRRKMINYENDEESIISDDQMMSMNATMNYNGQNYSDGLNQIQNNMNQMNRMRNKAMTPQVNSIPQFQSINQPHPQVSIPIPQQQPQPYIFDSTGSYPIIYGSQNVQYQQYQSPIIYPQQNSNQAQPMITIINPAPIQFPNYSFPQYTTNFNQHPSISQFGMAPQVSLHQQNQAPHVIHHQPTSEIQTQQHQQFISQQQQQNYKREVQLTSNNDIMIGGGNNSSRPIQNPNTSLIIGMDSQFFYPHSNSAENSLFLEEDAQLVSNPVLKQLSSIQMGSQSSTIQTQAYISPNPQNQHQQQQYYVMGYPNNYPQQIFQHPQSQNRQFVDSFRSNNNSSSSNNNNNNNMLSLSGGYATLNQDKQQQQQQQPPLSQRGSPLINPKQQIQQFQEDLINNQSIGNEAQQIQEQQQQQQILEQQ